MSVDLDRFIEDAKALKDEAEEGRAIKKAATDGYVDTPQYYRDPAPGYDGELRLMISRFVWGKWNTERRAVSLAEIFRAVREKVSERIEAHDWPAIWGYPIKRTVDRRTNEAADKKFYPDEPTPIVCMKPGRYVANPALFSEDVKEGIKVAGAKP